MAGVLAALVLSACSAASLPRMVGSIRMALPVPAAAPVPVARPEILAYASAPRAGNLDVLIAKYAAANNVPASLVHRVVRRESNYNPRARNGPYWGLMQIRHDTAKSMGYRGTAPGLLDAETNLKYAVRYLAGAYLVANRDADQAVRNYSRGYYYEARRKGLLDATGLN